MKSQRVSQRGETKELERRAQGLARPPLGTRWMGTSLCPLFWQRLG